MKKFLFLIIAVILILLGLNQIANLVIYSPLDNVAPMPNDFQPEVFESSDNTPLYGVYKPAQEGKPTILFFHGNAGNISYYRQFAEEYSALGYGIFLFDYRGFGQSKGTLNQENFFKDGKSALDYVLTKKQIPPQDLVLFAHSLGNTALIDLLQDNPLSFRAVILKSPFTNTPDMAASFLFKDYKYNGFGERFAAGLAYSFLFNKLFDNIAKMPKVKHPVFVVYSKQDMLISWQMSEAIFKAAPQGSKNYVSEFGGHNGFEWCTDAINAYIQSRK